MSGSTRGDRVEILIPLLFYYLASNAFYFPNNTQFFVIIEYPRVIFQRSLPHELYIPLIERFYALLLLHGQSYSDDEYSRLQAHHPLLLVRA